jgi:hypothetical protein
MLKTMKWIALVGMLLVSPAHADTIPGATVPVLSPGWQASVGWSPTSDYEWTEATWENAPRWLKKRCGPPPRSRYVTHYTNREICR